jgi:hypothetical protein
MTAEQLFEITKNEIIGSWNTITSVIEAEEFHELFIQVRVKFFEKTLLEIMPHYRGEQNYGWDIRSGIFRPPLKITDPKIGKELEQKA